jgi:exosortase/archaeosortase family protein
MLWAVTLWANRTEPLSGRYWLRLALAAPAALVANIARIFTLLAYRYAFFPTVETPQLHYFIGFLWIMPCLPVFVPRAGREPGRYLLETLFLVVALSLLSPFVPAPGGYLVTLATLLLLAQSRYAPLAAKGRLAATIWILAAGFIAAASMESLWLPWLILCPWFGGLGLRRAPTRLVLVLGTIPLVAMHPAARWFVAGAAVFEIWKLFQSGSADGGPTGVPAPSCRWLTLFSRAGLALLLVFPFIASSAAGLLRSSLRPPLGAMARAIAVNTYEVRLVGQPQDLQLIWYGPSGDGRHHTLRVCMRYRGIHLKPVGVELSVMTDGKVWMREFFLHQNQLLPDYRTYLRRTFWPWSPAGVHVISSASSNRMSAKTFAQQSEYLAKELQKLGEPLPDKGLFPAAARASRPLTNAPPSKRNPKGDN